MRTLYTAIMPDAEPHGSPDRGHRSNLLTIEGVDELHGTEHTILPDMIEVGSFIGMAAMTKSELTIKNVSHEIWVLSPTASDAWASKWSSAVTTFTFLHRKPTR